MLIKWSQYIFTKTNNNEYHKKKKKRFLALKTIQTHF
jgi:hypothetical protein